MQHEKMQQPFIDIKSLAECLSVKESTVYAWVRSGDIPHYKLGRLIRFKVADIELWMASKHSCAPKKAIAPKPKKMPASDIDLIIRRAIDEKNGLGYTPSIGKSDRPKGLRKEA